MGHLRARLLFALIVYCGGFVTAIYVLAPADGKNPSYAAAAGVVRRSGGDAGQTGPDLQSNAAVWKQRVQNVVYIAEEQACKAAELVKAQLARMQQQDDGRKAARR